MSVSQLARRIHNTAIDKGWWNHNHNRNIPEALALIHSEVSEALEEYRVLPEGMDIEHVRYVNGKPEGFAVELADIIIRVLDLSQGLGIDLDVVLLEKMNYNDTRPARHGGKRA